MNLKAMAELLEKSGDYRVLRKLSQTPVVEASDGGLFVDVETTGLDPTSDEIIELAMTPFAYGSDGRITEIGESFEGLREPAIPIPAHITAITGIDDAMVAGQNIDPDRAFRQRLRPDHRSQRGLRSPLPGTVLPDVLH